MRPTANPRASYIEHGWEINNAVLRVLNNGEYILGSEVKRFEASFADYIGVRHCVGVASGTDALILSLRAFGIGKEHEVITVSHTAVATVASIVTSGATPVLVDIEPDTFCIDTDRIERAITGKTRAIIPVHLYGNVCRMDRIMSIAKKHKLMVIEDCAQAHGARFNGKRVGSIGNAGCFSFYPTKNIGCFGDGGAITLNNGKTADKLRLLRQYGWKKKFVSEIHGYNSRLDELQAAVLNVKLKYLDSDNARRRALASRYGEVNKDSVYHLYVTRKKKRPQHSVVHYPVPIHLQPAYRKLVRVCGSMKETVRASKEVVSLPTYPQV